MSQTGAGATGQCDGGRRHHAGDRSSFTARLHAGRGYPGHAPSIRDHGPTAAGRGGVAVPQPVQGTERLESAPLLIRPDSKSPSPFGEIGAIIATVNATLSAHGGGTGGGTQSRPAPVVGCRGLQRSERASGHLSVRIGAEYLISGKPARR